MTESTNTWSSCVLTASGRN